ncbi:MAG TPA: hypothetical protein VKE69_05975 [Planctomycetota bacterium]|nr:hypothetical protein [Planctomycetota bacterium]
MSPRPVHRSSLGLAIAAAALLSGSFVASPASAQTFLGAINTHGHGDGFFANPFGLAFGPNGDLYVALAGMTAFDPGSAPTFNDDVVVRIDPNTNAIVADIATGLFPEEIAFASPSGGSTIGIVTNSSDGTVTIFDVATDAPVATVPLPGGFYASFPYAAVTNAAGTRAYVSVNDGTNSLQVIDLDPSSATVYQVLPSERIALAAGNGARMARVGNDLVVPSTVFLPMFAGSTAYVVRQPLTGSVNPPVAIALESDDAFFTYPSSQDVAVAPDGIAYVVGYDMHRRVYGFDVASGELVRSFPTSTFSPGQTGLALSPDGKTLVACDLISNEVHFVDVARGLPTVSFETDLLGISGYFQPNDAVFSPDGTKVYVTAQGSEAVLRFSAPPTPAPYTPALGLTVSPSAPAQGATVSFSTSGAGPNDAVAIFADVNDDALSLGVFGVLHITSGALTLAIANGADASVSFPMPTGSYLFAVNILCQALSVDLSSLTIKTSDEVPLVIQ